MAGGVFFADISLIGKAVTVAMKITSSRAAGVSTQVSSDVHKKCSSGGMTDTLVLGTGAERR